MSPGPRPRPAVPLLERWLPMGASPPGRVVAFCILLLVGYFVVLTAAYFGVLALQPWFPHLTAGMATFLLAGFLGYRPHRLCCPWGAAVVLGMAVVLVFFGTVDDAH